MYPVNDGPSDNAWGLDLVDPAIVSHQQKLVLFARRKAAPVDTLYFRVLDPSATSAGDDLDAWNGWYRYRFPEAVAAALPQNVSDAASTPARELRLAGMDLITVPPLAEEVSAADAAFRVASDGSYLTVARQSAAGTLLLNRVGLLASTVDVGGRSVERYTLEPAWEVRFRRSELRDVPLDDVDGQSYLDPVGNPFYEPTLELSHVTGISAGAFDLATVPSALPDTNLTYVVVTTSTGAQLHQIRRTTDGLVDLTTPPVDYPLLQPILRSPETPMTPVAGLAPSVAFYAEQDRTTTPTGAETELQRAGHLMVVLPVTGSGLDRAVAVYDFALDADGGIPVLPAGPQSVPLVDGTVTGGTFVPDTTSPSYPAPDEQMATITVVDRLVVTTMVLGQVQPHTSPSLHFGDDGLVHLYHGGPTPTPPLDRWSSLDPDLPQAMVAQFDARANHLTVSVPWTPSVPEEGGDGEVDFVGLQSGVTMTGATVEVSDGSLGDGPVEDDLCTVRITYPTVTTLPSETWRAVPRSLGAFMDVLNGAASGDSADPAVLSGDTSFYDATGSLPLARVPIALPDGVDAGPAPRLSIVSTLPDLPLTSVGVAAGADGDDLTLRFATPDQTTLTVTWRNLPPSPRTYGDVLDGTADHRTYDYPADTTGTTLFGLGTDAPGLLVPAILFPEDPSAPVTVSAIAIERGADGLLTATFDTTGGGIVVGGLPAAVDAFAAGLRASEEFARTGLAITTASAAGDVRPTPAPVGPMGLAETAVLFDALLPDVDLDGATVTRGDHTAGRQGHILDAEGPGVDPASELDPSGMVGFAATSSRPQTGAPAYVQNTPAGGGRVGSWRTLAAGGLAAARDDLTSGAWVRTPPQRELAFSPGESATVPVVDDGKVIPASINLRPQWDWTFESWIRPEVGRRQRLATFTGGIAPDPTGAPAAEYAVALEGQSVLAGGSYAKKPGTPDSSYFQTLTSTHASFMPKGGFTWEAWVKPDDAAGPPPVGNVTPIGGIVQLGAAGRLPFLRIGLTADRHVHIITVDPDSRTTVSASAATVPAVEDGMPTWSHLAVTGTADANDGTWTIRLLIDAEITDTFPGIALQDQASSFLVIGANTTDDATLYGSVAQLRYWSHARSAADIRRTWLTSMSGSEPGLLGNWPLTAIEAGGPTAAGFVRNTATVTSTDWDAGLYRFAQPIAIADDSFFLSVVASVGGLPAMSADALLANERWNHLALVYRAGGALDLNPPDSFDAGRRDWASCANAGTIGDSGNFAVDCWLLVPAALAAEEGTILARWAGDADEEDQSFRFGIDGGELTFSVVVVDDEAGGTRTLSARSSGAAIADGLAHHVAVVLSTKRASGDSAAADWTITFHRDGDEVGTSTGTIDGITTIDVRSSSNDLTIGTAYAPVVGAPPTSDEALAFLQGTLGELRAWDRAPSLAELFPERFRRGPGQGEPRGIAADWSFREQAGRTAVDSVQGIEATLTSSALWAALADTSTLTFVANGAWIGNVGPDDTPLAAVGSPQFTLGAPTATPALTGFTGDIAQVSLFDEARSVEEIQDQMYVPRHGSESGLVACWNFDEGGADITGGGNDITGDIAARIHPSTAPLSNEGPYVRNVYGGVVNDHSQSAPGRIAVGSYADGQHVGTTRQRAVLKRQYVVDPDQTPSRAIQIGELELTYVGQVQTDPTLIGYIEGAPPVPSENLTRPWYLKPDNTAYTRYLDTTTVALVQEAAETLSFTSSSSYATQVDVGAAIGLLGIRNLTNLNMGAGPFSIETNSLDARGIAQAIVKGSVELGGSDGAGEVAAWGASQTDTMGLNGDWEPFEEDPENYLNPTVGRRFAVDNNGYALVESLTADLYALTFGPTGAAVGTLVLPNPAIPPDRNILLFPITPTYSKNGTLDGKVGLVNDPSYPGADVRRGSLFNPVEAYAMAARVDQQRARARSVADQFDAEARAHEWNTDLDDARSAQSQDFTEDPSDAVALATPVQGLADRYVWTADGGLHAESQTMSSTSTRTYAGNIAAGGGGGFHADGEFFIKVGVAWSFDVMATHRVDVSVAKESSEEQALHLELKVEGEPFLKAFHPDAPAEYGDGLGAFGDGAAPGKVKGYRFMSFYLPPSSGNSTFFTSRVVDGTWLRLSNDPNARALRQLDASSPTWRVLHRVTYVERIPPPVASRPMYTPYTKVVAPVNVEGNADLVRLVDAQIPAGVTERTRLIVGRAVATTLNPAKVDGTYPPAALTALVPWWGTFLDLARSGDGATPAGDGDAAAAAAALLHAIVTRTTGYMFDGYASGAFEAILAPDEDADIADHPLLMADGRPVRVPDDARDLIRHRVP